MEAEDELSVMTIRTRKRVVKVRQPANIYFKLKEIPGLPKQTTWETDNSVMSAHKICPPSGTINQDLLYWTFKSFRKNYDSDVIVNKVELKILDKMSVKMWFSTYLGL